MNLYHLLIPETPRAFPALRWVRITLRTLHLVGIAGLGGGFLYGAEPAMWQPYLLLTVYSGAALVAVELWSTCLWLIQLRGIAVVVKLALIAWMMQAGHLAAPLFVAVVMISGVIAHAPASVRYFSIFHWRRIDSL